MYGVLIIRVRRPIGSALPSFQLGPSITLCWNLQKKKEKNLIRRTMSNGIHAYRALLLVAAVLAYVKHGPQLPSPEPCEFF
mmetsp:Transcript_2595/g.4948  ORF Transcript_2595/g.4948 Transcript_2595/m.4948 type:complete len:81 (+) Transcript_2595:1538-1780(+)